MNKLSLRNCRLLLFSSLMFGCGTTISDPEVLIVDSGTLADSGTDSSTQLADTANDIVVAQEVVPDDPCERFSYAESRTDQSEVVEWSNVHAMVRFFGVDGEYTNVDGALIESIGLPLEEGVRTYASELQSLCVVGSTNTLSPPIAALSSFDDLVIVQPGEGDLEIPIDARIVAIDLRTTPEYPELADHLTMLVSSTLLSSVSLADRKVRYNLGSFDQIWAPPERSPYQIAIRDVAGDEIAAGGQERVLIFLTGAKISPTAARFAISLRQAGVAHLIGADLPTVIAESDLAKVGDSVVAIKTSELLNRNGSRLPDLLLADARFESVEALAEIDGLPAEASFGDSEDRPSLVLPTPFEDGPSDELTAQSAEAALIISHGILKTFFPYFDVVGDTLDPRLVEVVSTDPIDPSSRKEFLQRLGRLTEAAPDGHVFLSDFVSQGSGEFPGFYVTFDGNEAWVEASLDPNISQGDRLMQIDGIDLDLLVDASLAITSAATIHYKRDLAFRKIHQEIDSATLLTFSTPTGETKEVSPRMVAREEAGALFAQPFLHRAGWLEELGADDVYYLNLDRGVAVEFPDDLITDAHMTAARSAEYVIVDMRGYPGAEAFEILPQLSGGRAASPKFGVPEVFGTILRQWSESDWTSTSNQYISGQIYLLVGPRSVSAAETISQIMRAANDPVIIGRTSAGTNGNITGAMLPGRFAFTFTGMRVANPDSSTFHGVGIVPSIVPNRTREALADGRDVDIEAALEHIRGIRN